jgi:hypothetical protein
LQEGCVISSVACEHPFSMKPIYVRSARVLGVLVGVVRKVV